MERHVLPSGFWLNALFRFPYPANSVNFSLDVIMSGTAKVIGWKGNRHALPLVGRAIGFLMDEYRNAHTIRYHRYAPSDC